MKKLRIMMMASAFAIAIGGAFMSTNANADSKLLPAYEKNGGSCDPIQTDCNTSGTELCSNVFLNDDCKQQLSRIPE